MTTRSELLAAISDVCDVVSSLEGTPDGAKLARALKTILLERSELAIKLELTNQELILPVEIPLSLN